MQTGADVAGPAVGVHHADELELLASLAKGGSCALRAVSAIHARYTTRLLVWLMSKGVPKEDAQDIVSAMFERLVRAARDGLFIEALPNYLKRSARNGFRDWLRRKISERKLLSIDEGDAPEISDTGGDLPMTDYREVEDADPIMGPCIRGVLERFSEQMPQIAHGLALASITPSSVRDVWEKLRVGYPEQFGTIKYGAFRQRLTAARHKLRDMLRDHCGYEIPDCDEREASSKRGHTHG